MIAELGVEPAGPGGLSRAALPIVLASIIAALALPADRNSYQLPALRGEIRRLVLPSDVSGVRISAMPDRLFNDPPPADQTIAVTVRGKAGIGGWENGRAILTWIEGGVAYTMTSSRHSVPELAEIAAALR